MLMGLRYAPTANALSCAIGFKLSAEPFQPLSKSCTKNQSFHLEPIFPRSQISDTSATIRMALYGREKKLKTDIKKKNEKRDKEKKKKKSFSIFIHSPTQRSEPGCRLRLKYGNTYSAKRKGSVKDEPNKPPYPERVVGGKGAMPPRFFGIFLATNHLSCKIT
ncbi:hypothetical protein CEXT_113721 [Caerostris extrusa]|uniref:Uncharacterized protein n=1 Tax=Caerostris extrusa TaxID=172846 RepID=A0AAV4QX84_CAEEX|nr:hypothetical protein CEXT_113721 [Caerostris extrusa]